MIEELKDNEIFVFGSNLAGKHLGGSAKQAHGQFKAEWGVGEGMTGLCYAFPTLTKQFKKRMLGDLMLSRNKLFITAEINPDKTFILTKVGCGIAGYSEEDMKPLFWFAPKNIKKPNDW